MQRITSLDAYALTRQTLSRLLVIMNDKQNKTMRQFLLRRAGALDEPRVDRRLWFVRIDQTWDDFFQGIPEARLRAIAGEGGKYPKKSAATAEILDFLDKNGVDLAAPKKHYDVARAQRANAVETNFTGLDDDDVEALKQHAMWQVYACRAVYGPILEPNRGPGPLPN